MVRAVGGDLHHKPVLPELAHQRRILAHRVKNNNTVAGGEEHIDKLPLSGEALARARYAEV